MACLQKFASVHANIRNHFNSESHLVDRSTQATPLGSLCQVASAVQLNPHIKDTRPPIGEMCALV